MLTTLGCWSDAAACASCRNRLRRSSCRAIDSFMTLTATVRSSTESVARYTTPIAPSPTSSMMWYLPMSGRADSVMETEKYAVGRGRLTRISFNGRDWAIINTNGALMRKNYNDDYRPGAAGGPAIGYLLAVLAR